MIPAVFEARMNVCDIISLLIDNGEKDSTLYNFAVVINDQLRAAAAMCRSNMVTRGFYRKVDND